MWTRNVPIRSALCGFLAAALFSPGALDAQGPAAPPAAGNLLQQVKWLRLEIAGGRIVAKSDRCSQSRYSAEASTSGESRQTLNMESQASALVIRYEQVDAASRLILDANEQGQLVISRSGASPSDSDVCFQQPKSGKVKLTVGGLRPNTVAADDLWQLLVAERELCSRHLLPLLATFRPNWRLDEQLDQLEAALIARAGTDVPAERRQWQKWIDDLAAADFARRQAADRNLRQLGQPVLAYLRGLDASQLDGEQRRRIRAILADLPDGSPDGPERAAEWLAADKRVWLALLARGELEQRIAAAEHLSQLCGRRLTFDPQAAAHVRQAQLAELAAKLAGN
jgi:hypothetical protein